MWYLTNINTNQIYYILPGNPRHTVGRARVDLLIQNDDSISRNHALLCLEADGLTVRDSESRYGTFVNDNIATAKRIPKDAATKLADGDRVQFGCCESLWAVGCEPFRCLTSTLAMSNDLKAIFQKVGAKILPSYDASCTHLVMPTVTVTTKLLLCLVEGKPVVSPEYFRALSASVDNCNPLPSSDNYIPQCTETYIRCDAQDFLPKPDRKTIFVGKEFIFTNMTHCKQFEEIVKLAGASCLCMARDKIPKSRLLKGNVVVVNRYSSNSSQSQSQTFDSLTDYITASGRRVVPDVEIGLAILYCSTLKYCNPTYNFSANLEPTFQQTLDAETLAKNSEAVADQQLPPKPAIDINIPESEAPATVAMQSADIDAQSEPEVFEKPQNAPAVRRSKRTLDVVQEKVPVVVAKRTRRSVAQAESPNKSKALESSVADKTTKDSVLPTSEPTTKSTVAVEKKRTGRKSAEAEKCDIVIPETPATQSTQSTSQSVGSSGFLSVNRESEETVDGVRKPPKRPLNLLLADGEDFFNFQETSPKRTKKQQENPSNRAANTRTTRDGNKDDEDLFSFEPTGSSGSSAAQGRQQRQTTATPRVTQSASNITADFTKFVKPVTAPVDGWLSTSLRDLKLEPQVDESEPGMECSLAIKIKREPIDASGDELLDVDTKTRRWLRDMENMFQVVEKSFKLVSRRPYLDESSISNVDGAKNFKAFVKKRNYKSQQTAVPTRSVCVSDISQVDI